MSAAARKDGLALIVILSWINANLIHVKMEQFVRILVMTMIACVKMATPEGTATSISVQIAKMEAHVNGSLVLLIAHA